MRRILALTAAVLACIAGTAALVAYYRYWQSWASYETGSRNTAGTPPNYNYWSGFGSVFPWGMGILTGMWTRVYQNARSRNCHTHGCWRLGSYPVGDYTVCKRHHREVTGAKVDVAHLKVHHHLHRRKRLLDAGYKTKDEP